MTHKQTRAMLRFQTRLIASIPPNYGEISAEKHKDRLREARMLVKTARELEQKKHAQRHTGKKRINRREQALEIAARIVDQDGLVDLGTIASELGITRQNAWHIVNTARRAGVWPYQIKAGKPGRAAAA
jgi:hypothetical protein